MFLVSFYVIKEHTVVAQHCKSSCWSCLWKGSLLAVHSIAWLKFMGYGSEGLTVLPCRKMATSAISLSLSVEPYDSAFPFSLTSARILTELKFSWLVWWRTALCCQVAFLSFQKMKQVNAREGRAMWSIIRQKAKAMTIAHLLLEWKISLAQLLVGF